MVVPVVMVITSVVVPQILPRSLKANGFLAWRSRNSAVRASECFISVEILEQSGHDVDSLLGNKVVSARAARVGSVNVDVKVT